MSYVLTGSYTCRVCGEEVEITFYETGYVHEGAPLDLDFRAPGGEVSYDCDGMHLFWVQRCSHCGYIAIDIEDYETTATPEWLESEEYLGLDGVLGEDWQTGPDKWLWYEDENEVGQALCLYRLHKLALHDGNPGLAADALLRIAWRYDGMANYGTTKNKQRCRERARQFRQMSVPLFEKALREDPDDVDTQLVLLDVKRRAGMFDEVLDEYHEGMFGIGLLDEDPSDRIVAYQLELCRMGYDGRHTMAEIPPSFVSQANLIPHGVAAAAGSRTVRDACILVGLLLALVLLVALVARGVRGVLARRRRRRRADKVLMQQRPGESPHADAVPEETVPTDHATTPMTRFANITRPLENR